MLDSLEKLDLLLLRVTLRLVTRVLRSSLGEPDHRDQSRPEWKASPDYPLSCALPYRFGGSEPNGEIRILDAETIKG